jgi:hypothetical protein
MTMNQDASSGTPRATAEAGRSEIPYPNDRVEGVPADPSAGCRIMPLPARLQQRATEMAARFNPVNSPLREIVSADDGELLGAGDGVDQPQRLSLLTTKYWGPEPRTLTVSFMEAAPADLRGRIVSHLNAWSQFCGIAFAETAGTGDVRISRGLGGYWSYLGTDVELVPASRQTMNLQGLTMTTPESEYRRVIRHQAGHTLGIPHERMRKALVDRIDPQKAYAYFLRTEGWDKQMVDQQVLTTLDATSTIGTEPDQDSIMCYQLPAEITKDGEPIRGGTDINDSDARFAALIYPKPLRTQQGEPVAGAAEMPTPIVANWDASEDVPVTST